MEVDVDGWGIDVCYSGTQKCLSCPPGLAPITFSDAAVDALKGRESKVQSWYLDMSMVEKYWGSERLYHHTAPINMVYGLHEALRIVLEEGLEARWRRHAKVHADLKAGLEKLGLAYLADPAHQLPMLNAVATPPGVDEAAARKALLVDHDIEIGAGLGRLQGPRVAHRHHGRKRHLWPRRRAAVGAQDSPPGRRTVTPAAGHSCGVRGVQRTLSSPRSVPVA